MKTESLLAVHLFTHLVSSPSLSAAPESETPDFKLVHIVTLDDLSGPEVEQAHGMRRGTPEDLQVLFDGVALTGLRVHIDPLIMGEDASYTRPTSFRVEALDERLPDAPNLRIYRSGDETRRLMEEYNRQHTDGSLFAGRKSYSNSPVGIALAVICKGLAGEEIFGNFFGSNSKSLLRDS